MKAAALPALLGLLASGCDRLGGPDAALCAPPAGPPGPSRAVTPEQRELTGDCVWYWSYRLAGAEGSVAGVADAVVGACWATIERLETMSARDEERAPDVERAALPFRRDAMYRVAEARAGDCEPPPA